MNKWLKLSDLPNDFWAECFVSVYDEMGIFTELNCVKKVNGCWNFEIRKGEVLAKSGNYIVNRWPDPNYYEMEIPDTVKGDYNKVMNWARKEYKRVVE